MTKSILPDPKFSKGFQVKDLGGDQGTTNTIGYFPRSTDVTQRIPWSIAQWMAVYRFTDEKVAKEWEPSKGVYFVSTLTETFGVDTNTGLLTFECLGSKCYDQPRTGSEGWMHLLIQSNFSKEAQWTKISELSSLTVSLDTQLVRFEDAMGDQANASIHAAQFLMYLSVSNMNPDSKDYGKYIWFGIGMFDNRTPDVAGGAMMDKGTGSMMYGLASKDTLVGDYHYVKDGKIQAGENTPWVSYRRNIRTDVEVALAVTQYKGYLKDTTLEDLYVSGMNIGWEMPGSYDARMLVKNLDVVAGKKAS